MKFIVSRASGWNDLPPLDVAFEVKRLQNHSLWGIEINTLEELLELSDSLQYELIVGSDGYGDIPYSIMIYDAYVE